MSAALALFRCARCKAELTADVYADPMHVCDGDRTMTRRRLSYIRDFRTKADI